MRFITQATKVLNEQKKSKRRLAVFMCLAAVVALGTVAALKMYGQAMSHKEKRFVCTVEAHRHTDACYDADGNLVCGQADYLVHTHNDDCYGADGELVCHLPEIAAHTHTDACYTEEDVLVCTEQEQAHQHTDACYTPQRGELTCQLEEHTHGDDCYDSETGELTCQLEEHQHGDACYAWEEVLTCPYAAGGHQHNSDCYTRERGELTCPLEEHTHGDDCYDENGELTCQIEEHTHDDNCYAWEDVLTCQLEETPAGHTHTDACYEKKKILTCGQLELHTHTEDCYDENGALACGLLELKEHTHQEECFETVELTDEEVAQKLEQEKMEESFQGEDPGNAPENGMDSTPDDGTESVSGDSVSSDEAGSVSGDSVSGDGISADSVSGNSVSGDVLDIVSNNDADVHEHDETCYDAAGGLMCGYEDLAEPTITQTYKDENEKYIVTAAYKKDANIPEDAELRAEMITAESDGEHFAKREAEMKETLQDEDVKMDALFKIGFYENGKEVEPESDVMVTVQFLDEEGLADGTPMTIIHFGEDGNEILGGTHVKDKSTTFKTNKFSDFAAIFRNILTAAQIEPSSGSDAEKVHEDEKVTNSENNVASSDSASDNKDNGGEEYAVIMKYENEDGAKQREDLEKQTMQSQTIRVSESDTYISPDGTYEIDFKIEGKAKLPTGVTIAPEEPKGDGQVPTAGAEEEPSEEAGSGQIEEDGADSEESPDENPDATEVSGEVTENDNVASADVETEGDTDEEATGSGEEAGEAGNDSAEGESETLDTTPETTETEDSGDGDDKLKFQVECMDENDIPEQYKVVKEYTEKESKGGEQLLLDVLSYSLTYDGHEVDVSECEITAKIKPTRKLLKMAAEQPDTVQGDISAIFTFMGLTEEPTVNKIDEIKLDYDNVDDTVKSYTVQSKEYQYFAARAENEPNPHFNVQYYANLEKVAYNDDSLKVTTSGTNTNEIPVIDTEGGKLPQNGKGTTDSPNDNSIRKLYVDTGTGKLKTKTELTKVYETRSFEYYKAPTIKYINALIENTSYTLKEVWVLKEEKSADSIKRDDWNIYPYSDKLHFTNRESSAGEKNGETYVWIPGDEEGKEPGTLRLVYNTTDNDKDFEATFYDYDIGDGKIYASLANAQSGANGQATSTQGTGTWYMRTGQQGINNPGNYTGSGSKLAFGNANAGSGLQHVLWGGNLLNKHNGTQGGHPTVTGSYKGCTFGLAKALVNGQIQYSDGVNAPKLFNEGDATGKTQHDDYSLKFNRVGDTHTLIAVNGTQTNNLDSFNNPIPYSGKTHYHIWTNNFWPMDSANSYGTNGHDMKFGNYANRTRYKFAGQAGNGTSTNGDFPYSDDGEDHNSFFGMHYKVEFDLVADYVGPLEYYFFGDDDMWVFLGDEKGNGKLVCDIGGVHSSVGEYLNLWDYIDKEKEKIHRHTDACYANGPKNAPTCGYVDSKKFVLNFYYTERGESGSSCWMQFTLPSVSSITPETTQKDYGNLKVEKKVVQVDAGTEKPFANNDKFEFRIHLTDAAGNNLKDHYSYIKYNADGTENETNLIVYDGSDFVLKGGQYIEIKYLPIGTRYTITEGKATTVDGDNEKDSETDYFTDIDADGGTSVDDKKDNKIAEGSILKDQTAESQVVLFKNKIYLFNLPKTGGPGTILYVAAGMLFLLAGMWLIYRKKIVAKRV